MLRGALGCAAHQSRAAEPSFPVVLPCSTRALLPQQAPLGLLQSNSEESWETLRRRSQGLGENQFPKLRSITGEEKDPKAQGLH